MAIEVPSRFDSGLNFNGPDVYPLDPDLREFSKNAFPKSDSNVINTAVKAIKQIDLIPDKEMELVTYDLDQIAMDNPFGRRLLRITALHGMLWATAQTNIAYSQNPAEAQVRELNIVRNAVTKRVARMRMATIIGYTPGNENAVESDKRYKDVSEIIDNVTDVYNKQIPRKSVA
jgi:hypothetical protein